MAEEKLGKTYRIDDRRYDKQGAKVEVWTKGRHKFVLWYSDASGPTSKEVYIDGDKISASLTDDEVINALLAERKKAYEFNKKNNIDNPNAGDWKIIQDPYGPYEKRTYGIDYYYLNDGSYFHIVWTEGTSIRSSDNDDATSFINKRVELFAPESAKLSKYYRMGKDSRFGYASDVGYDWLVYSGLSQKDSDIVKQVIDTIKLQQELKFGTPINDNKLALCDPDTKSCSIIEFKDFLGPIPPTTAENLSPEQSLTQGTTQSTVDSKYPITLDGIDDVLEIKALTNFSIPGWIGKAESVDSVAAVEEGEEIDEEYQEAAFLGEGEQLQRFEDPVTMQIEQEVAANTNFSAAAIESGSEIGGSADASSNGDGTVSALLASSPTTTPEAAGKYKDKMVPAGFNGTPIYSQASDPRWKSKPYDLNGKCGDNSTVGSSGCGPTSMSMLVNHWAAKGKSKFTSPHDMAKLFERCGCRVCGSGSGISGNKIKEAFKNTFGLVIEMSVGVAKVEKYVKAGYPAVISGKGYNGNNAVGNATDAHYNGGHFVCLTGVDSQGRIRVNDPGRAANAASEKNPGKGAITHFPAGKGLASCVGVGQTIIVYPVGSPVA